MRKRILAIVFALCMNVNGTVSVESGGKISIYSTAAFSNLMLNSGSTLTLTAGSLETKSEPEDNVPAIAQIWVNGGTLNAAGGSTVYYTSGTMSLPSNLAGVSVGYRVISLEELTAALSDIRVTSVMIQDSFSASGNVILSKDTMGRPAPEPTNTASNPISLCSSSMEMVRPTTVSVATVTPSAFSPSTSF